MTSKNSAYKLSRAVRMQIKDMRTLGILMGISYILLGPIALLMELIYTAGDMQKAGYQIKDTISSYVFYLGENYFNAFYFAVLGIGIFFGVYLTYYQSNRKQSDYYHSLPIKRSDLLTERLLAATVVQAIFLAVVCIVPPLVASFYPEFQGEVYEGLKSLIWVWSAENYINLMLIFLFGLSMAIFAGQLTGNSIGHILMLIVLNATIPALGGLMEYVMSCCYDTYQTGGWATRLINFNTMSVFSDKFSGGKDFESIGQYAHSGMLLSTTTYVVIILLTICFIALSYWLYNRRPAEKAGETLMYRLIGTGIKMIYVLLAAFTIGSIFGELNFIGFIFGAVLGGIVVHMVSEMIYSQDLFGVKKHMLSTILAMITSVLIFGCTYTGVIDYDHYIPRVSSVSSVAVSAIPDDGSFYNNVMEASFSDNPEYIAAVLDMAREATLVNVKSEDITEYYTENKYADVLIGYTGKTGVQTYRRFTLKIEDAVAIFGELSNSQEYNMNLWRDIVNENITALSVNYVDICPSMYNYISDVTEFMVWNDEGGVNKVYQERIDSLLGALRTDLSKRNRDIMASHIVAYVDIDGNSIPIYEKDVATTKLLNQWRKENILPTEEDSIKNLLKSYTAAIIRYDEDAEFGFTVERVLTNEDELVNIMTKDVIKLNQMISGGIEREDDTALALFYRDGSEEVNVSDRYFDAAYFFQKGLVPTEASE